MALALSLVSIELDLAASEPSIYKKFAGIERKRSQFADNNDYIECELVAAIRLDSYLLANLLLQ